MVYGKVCACSNTQLPHAFWQDRNSSELQFEKLCKEATYVLVSYLERNQVFEVPSMVEDNIAHLTNEVLKSFTFGTSVNLEVTSKSMPMAGMSTWTLVKP